MDLTNQEALKNEFTLKLAPYGLMALLFADENEESVRQRRNKLSTPPLRGRPKTATVSELDEFIAVWNSNSDKAIDQKFQIAHNLLGKKYDVLWYMYLKAGCENSLSKKGGKIQ